MGEFDGVAMGRDLLAGERITMVDSRIREGEGGTTLYDVDGALVGVTVDARGDRRAWRFPMDPGLASLPQVWSPHGMTEALRALPGMETVADCTVRMLRYRPGRRCTLDVAARHGAAHAEASTRMVVKVFHDHDKCARVYGQMAALCAAAAQHCGAFAVAGVAGVVPDMGLLAQEWVAGEVLDSVLHGPAGTGALTATAEGLAALHRCDLGDASVRPGPADIVAKLARRATAIHGTDPALAARSRAVIGALSVQSAALQHDRVLVHGDFKPSQVLIGEGPPVFIDFDHVGVGDPAIDVASFTATLMQRVARSTSGGPPNTDLRCAADHFVDVYSSACADPGALAVRVAWYESAVLLRKAHRHFARSSQSPEARVLVGLAEQRCEHTERMLR